MLTGLEEAFPLVFGPVGDELSAFRFEAELMAVLIGVLFFISLDPPNHRLFRVLEAVEGAAMLAVSSWGTSAVSCSVTFSESAVTS